MVMHLCELAAYPQSIILHGVLLYSFDSAHCHLISISKEQGCAASACMLDEYAEDIASSLSRLCVSRAIDCASLTGDSNDAERCNCLLRELWRETREAELVMQLHSWQERFLIEWPQHHTDWNNNRGGYKSLRDAVDECTIATCHITPSFLTEVPFAALAVCAPLFSAAGPAAELLHVASAERLDEVGALVEQMNPAETTEARETRRQLLLSRREWRLLLLLWVRYALSLRNPPSQGDCTMLFEAVQLYLCQGRARFHRLVRAT
ncbi:hypothetical protein ERJ75_000767000 [Trypanosoma vivax]|uniref:Uncharacterized protein n=1 Tax=Trypanosoma vivax (strain Y486) TaxID=1055687 RepID=G0U3R9_TRYVY|nr:hypothetical protein TRVL_02279 [Trypanosoma vivax]KAH8613907.1 hypothetical protein ERJ75_000767000 [Trypanosoma vivax]CCC50928.1 conserved hypothetical protein [Trypanosoma vivax Y486]